MKLAIIGAGKIVTDFLTVANDIPTIKLNALLSSTRSFEKNIDLASAHNITQVYDDYTELLTHADIDTVYVALPNHLHYSYSKQALLAGKHVICEKPFTLNSDQLDELVSIASDKQLILLEAITNQYLANFEQLQRDLTDLGDIKLIQCNYSQYSSRYDAFKEGKILPAFDPKMGGGALMDINIYNIHLVVGLFGEPLSVNYLANIEQGIDTSGVLTLDFGYAKAVAIGSKDTSAPINSTIQGRRGSIVIDGPTNTLQSYKKIITNGSHTQIAMNRHSHRMYDEFVEFNRIITESDNSAAKLRLAHSQAVMRTVDKALASANLVLG